MRELELLGRDPDLFGKTAGEAGVIVVTNHKTNIVWRIVLEQKLLRQGYFFCINVVL